MWPQTSSHTSWGSVFLVYFGGSNTFSAGVWMSRVSLIWGYFKGNWPIFHDYLTICNLTWFFTSWNKGSRDHGTILRWNSCSSLPPPGSVVTGAKFEESIINIVSILGGVPSLKLTNRPWKWWFPIEISELPGVYFQGRTVSFREGNVYNWKSPKGSALLYQTHRIHVWYIYLHLTTKMK